MSSDELAALTPETKAERINGSKWVLVSEEAMIMAIWSCKCWSYWNYEYIEGAFNVTADVTMLLVAIPLIAKVRLPWAQKAPILGIFGMALRHWGYKTPTNSRNTSQPSTTPNGGSGHRLASFNTQSFNRIHSVDLKGVTSEEHISPSSSLQINKDVTFAVEGDVTEEPVHSSQARPTVHGFLDGYNGTSTAFVSAA
ncbi:hypothetical protein LTR04_004012 [Oleoguttula sp. CCFEE 6159]|nr:hypothetical protein LTR04_004012 [Oleoguttula sp. CCFEE 6159]